MIGYIYITTNLKNNRKYIGKHKAVAFDTSYLGSGTILLEAIRKYGRENFSCEILKSILSVPTECNSEEELNNSEKFYIEYFNCVESAEYYNLKVGGEGGCVAGTKAMYKGNSELHFVRYELIDDYLAAGYTFGRPPASKETLKKRSESLKKVVHTEEWCLKISKALKGKKVSEETRSLISENRKGKTHSRNYWVHKDGKNTRITFEELESYLNDGWLSGMISQGSDKSLKRKEACRDIRYVFKDKDTKIRIKKDELDYYLSLGYKEHKKDLNK